MSPQPPPQKQSTGTFSRERPLGGTIGFLSNDTVQLWATRAPPLSIQQNIERYW